MGLRTPPFLGVRARPHGGSWHQGQNDKGNRLSRYDLADAMIELVQNEVSSYGSDVYAEIDHGHESNEFENKVHQYLRNFAMGANCEVQRSFEHAVSVVLDSYMTKRFSDDFDIKVEVRIALRRIKELGEGNVQLLRLMHRFNSDLLDLLVEKDRPVVVPIEEIPSEAPSLVIIDDPVPKGFPSFSSGSSGLPHQ